MYAVANKEQSDTSTICTLQIKALCSFTLLVNWCTQPSLVVESAVVVVNVQLPLAFLPLLQIVQVKMPNLFVPMYLIQHPLINMMPFCCCENTLL